MPDRMTDPGAAPGGADADGASAVDVTNDTSGPRAAVARVSGYSIPWTARSATTPWREPDDPSGGPGQGTDRPVPGTYDHPGLSAGRPGTRRRCVRPALSPDRRPSAGRG